MLSKPSADSFAVGRRQKVGIDCILKNLRKKEEHEKLRASLDQVATCMITTL
jgi:hypothetical protein